MFTPYPFTIIPMYGLAYDYGSWAKKFSKNQSLYDRDNEERLINSNSLKNNATQVNTI